MISPRAGGIILLITGVILFIIGVIESHSAAHLWSEMFTGPYTNAPVWYIIVGIASAAVGLLLIMFGGRKATV